MLEIKKYRGEVQDVANRLGVSKQRASYNIKRLNPDYLDVLLDVRAKYEARVNRALSKLN
jgi:predicted transcriptional regulator